MQDLLPYSPIILVVMTFLIQQRLIVTPEQLEKKHREILEDVESRFASNASVRDLKEQVCEIKDKVDKIYDYIINS